MADDDVVLLERKIFFLYPSVFIVENIIEELIQEDFEVYMVKDEDKLQKALRKYPHSIVLACIDDLSSDDQREKWIKQIMNDKAVKGVDIGVFSTSNDDQSRRLFLITYNVSCGFFPLKMDTAELVKSLVHMLESNKVKGRRKYMRLETRTDAKTTINLPRKDGEYIIGQIIDISAAGLSCIFPYDPLLGKNTLLSNMQIKLQTTLVKMDGTVFGSREDTAGTVYVIVFTEAHPSSRKKIKSHIQKKMQAKFDEEIY